MFLAVWAFRGHVLRWSGSVTNHHYFVLLNQTYVLCNVRSELFLVYGCRLFMFLCCFYFFQQTFILLFFCLISKGIFHLGGLVSKMHISVYMLFTEWKCFCFFHLLNTILGLWIFNAYSKYFITECEWFNSTVKRTRVLEYLHCKSISCALIQETHLKQSDVARFQNKYYKLAAFSCALNRTKGCLSL